MLPRFPSFVVGGGFIRASGILALSSGLATGFSYLYQLVMARLLTPEQFGMLASFLAIFVILSVLSPAMQLAAARFSSTAELTQVKSLWIHLLKRSIALGAFTAMLSLALIPVLKWALHIEGIILLLLLSMTFLVAFSLPVNIGILQGLQRFVGVGVANLGTPLVRLILGTIFVALGLGTFGAFLPLLIAFILVFVVTSLPMRRLPQGSASLKPAGIMQFVSWTSASFGAFIVLANVDVIFARHYLDLGETGDYAAIALLGKIVLFAPVGITLVMFPMTARQDITPKRRTTLLGYSLAYTVLASGSVVGFYAIFPHLSVRLLVGNEYSATVSALVRYGIGTLGLSVVYVLMHYYLSINRVRIAIFIGAGVVFQLGVIVTFHSSVDQLVNTRLATGVFAVSCIVGYALVGAITGRRRTLTK